MNNDLDGRKVRYTPPLPACEDGCGTTWLNSPNEGEDLVVHNEDEGGDKVTFHITMRNLMQAVVQP